MINMGNDREVSNAGDVHGGFEGDSTPEKGVKAHFRDYRSTEPKRVNSGGEIRLALVTS